MTLPNFLGIGVMRGGTTWLHSLLDCHPDVYVPTRRKEVYFFDLNFDRGLAWYEAFFPPEPEASRYQAIGEITPTYFYRPHTAERIATVPSIDRLILMLRNPIDRAYSYYGLYVKNGDYTGSFEAFMADHPNTIRHGLYSQFLARYDRLFNREQLLVLVFERAVADVTGTKADLARFLGIAAERFPEGAGAKPINRAYVPRVPAGYALARKVAWHYLRYRWNMDWLVNWGKKLGIERLFGEAGPLPAMQQETRQQLLEIYENEIGTLEEKLDIDLDCWRN